VACCKLPQESDARTADPRPVCGHVEPLMGTWLPQLNSLTLPCIPVQSTSVSHPAADLTEHSHLQGWAASNTYLILAVFQPAHSAWGSLH
jgi:hypothetical protein